MSAPRLEKSYRIYKLQLASYEFSKKAAGRAKSTPSLFADLGLTAEIGKKAKDPWKAILSEFDEFKRKLERQSFVDLVASFEYDLFQHIRVGTSHAVNVMDENYGDERAFADSSRILIRTAEDFSNLGGYRKKAGEADPASNHSETPLGRLIKYRDYLAHGERFEAPKDAPSVDEAYEILTAEITRIVSRRAPRANRKALAKSAAKAASA